MNDFETSPKRSISVLSGAQFNPKDAAPLPWLWEPYLAFGAVSIIDGDPGVAKSLIAVDLASRIGIGRSMPDGSPPAVNPITRKRRVLTVFVNADDSVRHLQIPRLLTASGDPHMAVFVGGVGEGSSGCMPFRLPDHYRFLADLLGGKVNLRGSFVVLDPAMAIFSRVGTSDAAARAAIDPLVRIAAESQCCVLLVRHLNKFTSRRSLYRGGGSIGIVGACRTALFAGEHPDDPERRVLAMSKSNLGPIGPSLGLRVFKLPARTGPLVYMAGEKHPVTGEVLKGTTVVDDQPIPAGPAIVWDGPTPISADDLSAAKRDHGAQSARAAEWLKNLLARGPVPATVVEAQALAAGLGYATVRAVKMKLGIESRRTVLDGQPFWEWMLPVSADRDEVRLDPVAIQPIADLPELHEEGDQSPGPLAS